MIKFQYNKTSLQQLEKQLKMRERSLPTIKSKESALRIEVKRTKDEVTKLELQLEQEIQSYENMMALWNEFNPELIAMQSSPVEKVHFSTSTFLQESGFNPSVLGPSVKTLTPRIVTFSQYTGFSVHWGPSFTVKSSSSTSRQFMN